jgi:hypothetical protein
MTTNASNAMCAKRWGNAAHSSAMRRPQSDNVISFPTTAPNTQARSLAHIVTKYAPGAA